MGKILGLDLGTNSIGWAIRETNNGNGNQIIDYGVIVFEKGVGDGKSGEFSLAAERRKNRSKRRLYNAKRYRKWKLLKILIKNQMCPLTMDELRLWRIGKWEQENGKWKNKGRFYPINNEEWKKWLAMDPVYFGSKGTSKNNKNESKPIRKNPYDLRCELIERYEQDEKIRKFKIGRALYHLAQRRGFQTSRKSGKSSYGKDDAYENWKANSTNPSVAQFYIEKLNNGERVRGRKPMQRDYVIEDDFKKICATQKLDDEIIGKLYKAIYYVRPLRTQKGLVGKCTLEKGKPRTPVSHPAFEEYRALGYINNIKWRKADKTDSNEPFEPIPMEIKKRIFEQLFFKKKRTGEIDTRNHFRFEEIVKRFSENYQYEFNYAKYDKKKPKENGGYELVRNPNVPTCPIIAGLMNVFNEAWNDKFITDSNRFGINWDGLSLEYTVQYGKKKDKKRKLNYEDIWHLLFDFIQIKDKEEDLKKFCKEVLGWNDEKSEQFTNISIQQGYGKLSKNAIVKILSYLQEGYLLTPNAILCANIPKVVGKEVFESQKAAIKNAVDETIASINKEKEKLNIVNGLIQKYFGENKPPYKPKGVDEEIEDTAKKDVEKKLKSFFGKSAWEAKPDEERKEYIDFVLDKYLTFLNGKQKPEEKASHRQGKNPDIDYYLLPRLDEAIKDTLKKEFEATEAGLKHLYHPSDIDIYPKSTEVFIAFPNNSGKKEDIKLTKEDWKKVKKWCKDNPTADVYVGDIEQLKGKSIKRIPQLESPEPPSKGWKNPMAMRTMYELKKLVNYLLEGCKIDKETKIVIEMARELNDANMRKAIEYWQNDRKKENEEYAKAIAEMYKIQPPSDDDYDKFRAAVEQIKDLAFSENKKQEFERKYADFVETFLARETDTSENMTSYNYLMHLILTRDEFVRLLNFKIPNSQKYVRQIIKTASKFAQKRNELKEMLVKYRLWKEQKFQCFYTGQQISFTELFSNDYQIEHTIPRSISFDSELKNLSVCDAVYNNDVKGKSFPTECPNYDKEVKCQTVKGEMQCSPIKSRVEKLIKPKVDELKKRIDDLRAAAKKIPDWEVDRKNANIRLRHYLQFELDYWNAKYYTFTVKPDDWKDSWKNSQLRDTQIITKYARAYMKSLFHRVDVQKASVTNEFKRILGFPEKYWGEQKDRSRHSHHAIDALALTLIPGSATREEILKLWYQKKEIIQSIKSESDDDERRTKIERKKQIEIALEKKLKPFKSLEINKKIEEIESSVLIKHIHRDNVLVPTRKRVRKRGKVQLTKAGNEMIMQGDSIRGQLHAETYLGAVKVPERNEQGYAIKENGKFKTKAGELWIVARKPIKDVKIDSDVIVDEVLKRHIQKQLENGKKISEVTDFQGNPIRHLRCRYKAGKGFLTPEKTIKLKVHSHPSKYEHKQYVLAKNNPDGNYLYLFYEKADDKEPKRAARIVRLFDVADKDFPHSLMEIKKNADWNKINDIPLKQIIKVGQKVMFYTKHKEELKGLEPKELQRRIFRVYKFNDSRNQYIYIYLQNIIEARPDEELGKLEKKKNGYDEFNASIYQYRLKLTADNLNCIFEGRDFEMKPDGEIVWKF